MTLTIVKTELKSPAGTLLDTHNLPLAPSHLDSTIFCANAINLEASQSSNTYSDHKQDYYNYYNRFVKKT